MKETPVLSPLDSEAIRGHIEGRDVPMKPKPEDQMSLAELIEAGYSRIPDEDDLPPKPAATISGNKQTRGRAAPAGRDIEL